MSAGDHNSQQAVPLGAALLSVVGPAIQVPASVAGLKSSPGQRREGRAAGAFAASPLGPGAFAGCVAGGVDGALWGVFTAPIVSFGHTVLTEVGMNIAYNNQINNVCSKL